MNQRYRLRYTVEPGDFCKEDAEGGGLTDAIVILSILYPPDGSYSLLPISADGRTGDKMESLSPHELFKAWAMWGHSIAKAFPEADARHETAKVGFNLLCEVIRSAS